MAASTTLTGWKFAHINRKFPFLFALGGTFCLDLLSALLAFLLLLFVQGIELARLHDDNMKTGNVNTPGLVNITTGRGNPRDCDEVICRENVHND